MQESPAETLMRLLTGAQVSQAIHVAATLGVADLLTDGPRTSEELAAETGAHAGSLYRLLRALAAVGVFHEDEEERFALTPARELLRSDVPGSLHGWAALIGRPYYRADVYGTDVWSYRAELPEESKIFDRAMESLAASSNRALLDAYDFGRMATVVDVGGGNGALLSAPTPRCGESSSIRRTWSRTYGRRSRPRASPTAARWWAEASSRRCPRAATPTR